ncbi:RNPC3 [Mytilus coruscus]|uniref:RNA-binding region-containing protein 3 n=1 Tax=Mytilus coruscus TaxID=42192 RepID=A0A6J8AQ49_MYTCO|nr:RNPC3 [Mytilus coruscus]
MLENKLCKASLKEKLPVKVKEEIVLVDTFFKILIMASVDDTLLVRHLPSQLSNGDKEELLRHFGAVRVKVMGTRGAMKHTAFVTFSDSMAATKALNRLHQLEVLGCKLVAEFAKKSQQKHFPSISDNQRGRKVTDEKQDKIMEDKTQNLPSADTVFKKWGVNYPKNPKLCYLYPPPTVSIITNIANALASCPRFYVQVLHLMNKMNLPAPFGAVTPTPPIVNPFGAVTPTPPIVSMYQCFINKMNLPAPFGAVTPTPPIVSIYQCFINKTNLPAPFGAVTPTPPIVSIYQCFINKMNLPAPFGAVTPTPPIVTQFSVVTPTPPIVSMSQCFINKMNLPDPFGAVTPTPPIVSMYQCFINKMNLPAPFGAVTPTPPIVSMYQCFINKMNLPAPFGAVTPTPPIVSIYQCFINKMNLPAPFGAVTPTPPIVSIYQCFINKMNLPAPFGAVTPTPPIVSIYQFGAVTPTPPIVSMYQCFTSSIWCSNSYPSYTPFGAVTLTPPIENIYQCFINKMNLPAPFGAVTPTPIPLKESAVILEPDNIKTEAMDVSSTEESEIESEGESQKKSTDQPSLKRHIRKKPKLSTKRPRFLENLEIPAQSNAPVMMPSKVFENVQEQLQAKKIQMKIPEAIVHEQPEETTKPVHGFLSDVLSSLNRAEESKTDGGFGKIEPVKKVSESVETKDVDLSYTVDQSKFLSIQEIKKEEYLKVNGRIILLYLKNLNKHTSEQDLVDIFGNYVDWNSETEKSMFDIRVMKEGRMKGQGFITLPSEESAEKAMNDTNGFVLNNKPMAVQYARSAKAKDATEEKS